MFIPIAYLTRLFGFFPLTWEHYNGKCVYKKSYIWSFWSIIVAALYIFQFTRSVDIFKLKTIKSLPILLNDITEAIYGFYVIILTMISFYRFPRWIKTMNSLMSVLKEGIFCQSSMKVVLMIQYSFIAMFTVAMLVEAGILIFLHFSENYESNFDNNIYINKFLQNVPFVFYLLFFTMISGFIGILGCFEKLTINCLKYTHIHPMKEINETNNVSDFFGIFKYKVCKEEHYCSSRLSKMPQPHVIEHLRVLHEDISLVIYEINNCLNPQFLCHTVVELTVLIIQWYAVIVYMAFEFKAPMASTIHVVNCQFVIMHSVGIFLFLKNAQRLKNMVSSNQKFKSIDPLVSLLKMIFIVLFFVKT